VAAEVCYLFQICQLKFSDYKEAVLDCHMLIFLFNPGMAKMKRLRKDIERSFGRNDRPATRFNEDLSCFLPSHLGRFWSQIRSAIERDLHLVHTSEETVTMTGIEAKKSHN
jgi:hypothetical protein